MSDPNETDEILDLLTEIAEQLSRQNQLIVLGATCGLFGETRDHYLSKVKELYASDTDE